MVSPFERCRRTAVLPADCGQDLFVFATLRQGFRHSLQGVGCILCWALLKCEITNIGRTTPIAKLLCWGLLNPEPIAIITVKIVFH